VQAGSNLILLTVSALILYYYISNAKFKNVCYFGDPGISEEMMTLNCKRVSNQPFQPLPGSKGQDFITRFCLNDLRGCHEGIRTSTDPSLLKIFHP
jgi:hypothetical protein